MSNDSVIEMDPTVSPVYLLRSYVWAVLKANMPEVWDAANYGGLTPIVPLAEEPELDEYSGPHIVYGYALDGTDSLYARQTGSMTFVLYDDNFRRLTKTMTILQTALGRLDETAKDVNAYTSKVAYTPPMEIENEFGNPPVYPFGGLSFGYIGLGFTEGGSPEGEEGGRQSALLNIRFDFFVDYDVITTVDPS